MPKTCNNQEIFLSLLKINENLVNKIVEDPDLWIKNNSKDKLAIPYKKSKRIFIDLGK
jgi:hypothetical protein